MKILIIIGAGGHGRVVADYAEQLEQYQKIAFLDDCFTERKNNRHWPIIGKVSDFIDHLQADFIVAFGDNALRQKTLNQLEQAQANIISLIHPCAQISPHCIIGKGVVVFANAVINIGADIKRGCIINTGAIVEHDCVIRDSAHIAVGVNIAGGVEVGELSWLGIGCSIVQYIKLAKNTQIGAGAVVTQGTEADSLYLGVPAKRVRSLLTHS